MTQELTVQKQDTTPLKEGDTVEILNAPAMIYIGGATGFKRIPEPKQELVGKQGRIWSINPGNPEPTYSLSGGIPGNFYADQLKRV